MFNTEVVLRKNRVLARSPWVKRAIDVVLGLAFLIVTFPVMVIFGAATKLTSRGPILFRQERVGLRGEIFTLCKIRTMHSDPVEEGNCAANNSVFQKIQNDRRVTKLGSLLRKYSIDELPQLLHVLTGKMSVVGPRPIRSIEYSRLQEMGSVDCRMRLMVKPGMTGLWQVSGRSDLSDDEALKLDLYYVKNWTIWLDIFIILKTVPAVLSGKGAR